MQVFSSHVNAASRIQSDYNFKLLSFFTSDEFESYRGGMILTLLGANTNMEDSLDICARLGEVILVS